ncbi:hypothetical protein PRIPAC_77353 [Pristionchus pacificus]|uniref:Uncharacterized protein n=1 Tax=Pristionchus pacificus TaxID=54126 RepID=A0A2A6BHI4_PRIPA|nr:hypothetical protein PRIPAC_77353 [Pristionchus pacificus]|eukprot:PDM65354.1 hypothetical protein PRIPAC_52296 [Pristionchus pacificus]
MPPSASKEEEEAKKKRDEEAKKKMEEEEAAAKKKKEEETMMNSKVLGAVPGETYCALYSLVSRGGNPLPAVLKKYEGRTFVLGANRQVKGGGIAFHYLPAPITTSSSLTAHTDTALRGNKRVKSWNTIAAHYHQATGRAHDASLPLLVDKQGGYHLAEELWVRLN